MSILKKKHAVRTQLDIYVFMCIICKLYYLLENYCTQFKNIFK